MSRFKYNPGDKIGPYAIEMVERTSKEIGGWKGIFKCPWHNDDSEHLFEAYIGSVQQGKHTSCGCKTYSHFRYQPGDSVGPNQLVFVKRTEQTTNGDWKGLFICPYHDKEVLFEARIGNISSGNTTSCGCQQKEKVHQIRFNDLTGQIFGKLTVLGDSGERDKNGNVYWTCQCSCENHTIIKVIGQSLKTGNTKSCGCIKKSSGEDKICSLLQELNIIFDAEKFFNDCKNPKTQRLLPFDFYLPDYNTCIEYDGELHYKTKNTGWDTEEKLKLTQYRDNIKTQFCKDNNIKLIRIPYWDYNNLDVEYLKEALKED